MHVHAHTGAGTGEGYNCDKNKKCELRFLIKPSLIPGAGEGLFAARPFGVGDTLLYYTGTSLGERGTATAESKLRKLSKGEAGRVMSC